MIIGHIGVGLWFLPYFGSIFATETSPIPVLEFQRSLCCVCVRLCVSVCVCESARVSLCVCVCLVCVRACAVRAVRWRLMVIAVSRLAFWVESARVGVERVARSRQPSSIPRSTPRTAPCVLHADRGHLCLRNSTEAQG